MVEQLIQAGANVFRLNFSHGSPEQHLALAAKIRACAARLDREIGILADLQGPKSASPALPTAASGCNRATLHHRCRPGQLPGRSIPVGTDYPALAGELQTGNIVLLDDGRIQLCVELVIGERIETRVLVGGTLSSRKGINVLGGGLSAPALTDKDKADILTARLLEADYIAVSFPRSAADLEEARTLIRASGSRAAIVAKVERAEVVASVAAMDELIHAADLIMVARGDLGSRLAMPDCPACRRG